MLDPEVLGLPVELERFDLSLENRRATDNEVCTEAAARMRETGLGLKAATITPEGADDVGSPNRLIREGIDGTVIVRTGPADSRGLPDRRHPPSDLGLPDGGRRRLRRQAVARAPRTADEIAYRTERISRRVCRAVSEHSFRTAAQLGARVYGGPKWTVSPVYEGMLKEEMDAAAERHPRSPTSRC